MVILKEFIYDRFLHFVRICCLQLISLSKLPSAALQERTTCYVITTEMGIHTGVYTIWPQYSN